MELNYTEDESFTENIYGEPPESEDLPTVHQVLIVISFCLIIFGILENAVVCLILVRRKKFLKSFSNFHLLNVAITDILFRIISTPGLSIDQIGVSDLNCKVADFGKYMTLAVTFSLLAGIAFDRYMRIVHPFRARRITWKHSRNLVVVSWIYGAVCSAPFLYSTKSNILKDEETLETFRYCYDDPGLPFQISVTVFVVFSFLIPLVFMGFAYGKILCVLWKRSRYRLIDSRLEQAKIRAVKMMVLVVLTYFLTWGPLLIWQTMDSFLYDQTSMFEAIVNEQEASSGVGSGELEKIDSGSGIFFTYLLIGSIFETMAFASSVLNPLIFGYYNQSFREEMKRFLCGNKCGQCLKKRKEEVCPHLGKKGAYKLDVTEKKETDFQTTRL